MTIKRHEPSKIYSKVVEANGFVFTAGIVADDIKQDAKGQTQQILKEIDRLLKVAGTDKTKVVSATIWVTDIRLARCHERGLERLDRRREPARPRLHRGQARRPAHAGRDRRGGGEVGCRTVTRIALSQCPGSSEQTRLGRIPDVRRALRSMSAFRTCDAKAASSGKSCACDSQPIAPRAGIGQLSRYNQHCS